MNMQASDLRKRAQKLMNQRMPRLVRPQPPVRQIAAIWFAAGVAVAAIVGFFFDSKEGAARRHMAYAKAVANRNRAMGMVSELRRKADDTPSEPMAGTGA